MIAICDYGMGNLRSVEKALERVGAEAVRTTDSQAVLGADGVIVPGVGAFGEAMSRIHDRGFFEPIRERAAEGTPVFGICLGMQLLFDRSTELGGAEGLGLIEGDVTGLDAQGAKVPNMGWSPVEWQHPSPLTDGVESGEPHYFVHSLVPRPAEPEDVLGVATYGESFACAVERGNVFGVQFHPEKSSAAGLRLLSNFAAICAPADPATSAPLRSASQPA